MSEKAWAMTPVWTKDPAVLAGVPDVLSKYMDGMADEKFGAGRWRRSSFTAEKMNPEPWRNDREAVALYVTGGDRLAADDLLAQEGAIPEDAHIWRGVAAYEPLEAPDA